MAIIPGYTDYSKWPEAEITLYQIPEAAVSDKVVVALITAEAAVHEDSHGVTANLMYGDSFIKLPNGEVIHGQDFTTGVFGTLAEQHPPITHYSSQFRDKEGKFKDDGQLKVSIGEELAETWTVFSLDYGSGVLTDMRIDPLADRPELKRITYHLMRSTIIPQDEGPDIATVTAAELVEKYSSLN